MEAVDWPTGTGRTHSESDPKEIERESLSKQYFGLVTLLQVKVEAGSEMARAIHK